MPADAQAGNPNPNPRSAATVAVTDAGGAGATKGTCLPHRPFGAGLEHQWRAFREGGSGRQHRPRHRYRERWRTEGKSCPRPKGNTKKRQVPAAMERAAARQRPARYGPTRPCSLYLNYLLLLLLVRLLAAPRRLLLLLGGHGGTAGRAMLPLARRL